MVVVLEETVATGDAAREGPTVDAEQVGPKRSGSRWNSTKHGLMAKQLFSEDLETEIQQLTDMFTVHFGPTNPYEVRLIAIMGRSGAQLERLQKLGVIDIQRAMDRAAVCHESDRCAETDKLAARISREPARIVRALGRTKQGAEWLVRNLKGLLEMRKIDGVWTEAQYALGLDLLGTRREFRSAPGTAATEAEVERLAERAAAEIERLERLLEDCLIALDEGAQAMAMAGFPGIEDADSRKHRKYENSARREFELAKADLLAGRAQSGDQPASPAPEAAAQPAGPNWDWGADPEPEPEPDAPEPASEAPAAGRRPLDIVVDTPLSEPVSLDELAAVHPQAARVVGNASKGAGPSQRPDHDRRRRHAQQKAARKLARRKGR